MINVERKFHDVNLALTPSSTPTISNLSNIAEGADYNNRDGHSIRTLSYQCRWFSTKNTNAVATIVRYIVFVDNSQRGTDPTSAELMETSDITSPLQHDVGRRFNVLVDQMFALNPNVITRVGKCFKKYLAHVKYSSTAAADASNLEGSIYLMVFSTEATNTPGFNFQWRLRYTDN